MKRIGAKIILIILFVALGIGIVLPLVGLLQFNTGKALDVKYRWKAADEKFDTALQVDSYNAGYYAETGRLYAKRAARVKNKTPLLLQAETRYKKAVELNPYSAIWLVELGAVEENLFLADPASYRDRLKCAVKYFKDAFEKDPNHYILNYDIGSNLLRVWDDIDGEDRRFTIERLEYCMELAPWYEEYIYPELWNGTHDFDALIEVTPEELEAYENLYKFLSRNNLWEFRRKLLDKIEELGGIFRPEFPQLTIEDGNIYWTGTVSRAISLAGGGERLSIQAKGTQAKGIWPYMIVELNGEEIGETYVDNTDWKDYVFEAEGDGASLLRITFANDGRDPRKGEDRNLFLGDIRVEAHER